MRFGNWRGVTLALAWVRARDDHDDGLREPVSPRTSPARWMRSTSNTGGPYYAPPIPYGHYAKDCAGDVPQGVSEA
jgi:hypothetical protein